MLESQLKEPKSHYLCFFSFQTIYFQKPTIKPTIQQLICSVIAFPLNFAKNKRKFESHPHSYKIYCFLTCMELAYNLIIWNIKFKCIIG